MGVGTDIAKGVVVSVITVILTILVIIILIYLFIKTGLAAKLLEKIARFLFGI